MIDMICPEEPNWQPLQAVIGDAIHCAPFMFMGTAMCGGITIYLYKHRDTKQYLNIDAAGNCYQYQHNTRSDPE